MLELQLNSEEQYIVAYALSQHIRAIEDSTSDLEIAQCVVAKRLVRFIIGNSVAD